MPYQWRIQGLKSGGGHGPVGGVDLRRGRFLAKMYAKTKELGPDTLPRSDNAYVLNQFANLTQYVQK